MNGFLEKKILFFKEIHYSFGVIFPDLLATMQADLRKQYLNEIEAIQRRVGGDDESWDSLSLDQTVEEIAQLQRRLAATDDLVLGQENTNNPPNTSEKQAPLDQEICCPICFEEMITPKQILCCSNGHAICSDCIKQIKACPVCRESFQVKESGGKIPKRNLFAERLVSLYLQSMKKT